jgi:6-phosphogluconolactonase (cycloisomerase 2 family)
MVGATRPPANVHQKIRREAEGAGNGVPPLDPLGSQDSLVLAGAGALLIAVDSGSNQLSLLTAVAGVLKFASIVSSGGDFPNSVAIHQNLVYVLNAHTPNIVGFRVDASGVLTPIAGAVFAVPGGSVAKPHDIRFTPDGTRLVVTVEGTNEIDIFALDSAGLVTGVTAQAAAGVGPFGFKFGRGGVLVNVEANSASASTYVLNSDDTLTVVSGALPDTQAATCWISLTQDGKFGFVSNTGSGTLSTYQISGAGTLNLESSRAVEQQRKYLSQHKQHKAA